MKLLLRAVCAIIVLIGANMARTPLYQLYPKAAENLWLISLSFFITPVLIFGFVWAITRRRFDWQFSHVAGVLGGTVIVAVPLLIGWCFLAPGTNEWKGEGSMAAAIFFLVVRSFILQGIPEELLFRGWLFSFSKERPLFTVVWTTLAFVAPHLSSSGGQDGWSERVLYLVLPLGMSILAGAVTVAMKSYWWAAGTHGGMHFLMGVFSAIAPKEIGPESWLILGGLQALCGLAILAVWAKRGRGQAFFKEEDAVSP